MPFALGRAPRIFDPRVPHMSALLAGAPQTPPPPSMRWALGMPNDLGMMLNDTLGCCTCAAVFHAIQLWSYHCNRDGLVITEPDGCVLSLYEAVGAYLPSNPSTDRGAVEQDVLEYLLNTGAPTGPKAETRHKLAAYVEIDPRNTDDVKRAIVDCGVVYIGFNVPKFLMSGDGPQQVWTLPPAWDGSTEGGHAVILTGYDADSLDLISWGQHYAMTWAFFAATVDEAYALADYDWINKTGSTPGGLSLSALETQMTALRS